jgi:hypothetical protein
MDNTTRGHVDGRAALTLRSPPNLVDVVIFALMDIP